MVKTLTRHGNSLALVIDKPLLEMMHLDETTPLSITSDGNCFVVAPVKDIERRKKFEAAKADTFKKYRKTLKRLAE